MRSVPRGPRCFVKGTSGCRRCLKDLQDVMRGPDFFEKGFVICSIILKKGRRRNVISFCDPHVECWFSFARAEEGVWD